jgi:predicted O-methyltransferase YrrM
MLDMRDILTEGLDDYVHDILPPRDEVLTEIEERAGHEQISIIGPAVGRLLYQYAQLIGARRIFEMGSAVGYSTIWLARACPQAEVFYTDGDPKNAEDARGYFERAGVAQRITIQVGDALELLDKAEGEFDLIFNDVNKDQYPRVFSLAVPRLRKGGLLITDNVLWSGRVSKEAEANDRNTPAIQEFTRMAYASPEVFTTIVPLRDGVAVCQKL